MRNLPLTIVHVVQAATVRMCPESDLAVRFEKSGQAILHAARMIAEGYAVALWTIRPSIRTSRRPDAKLAARVGARGHVTFGGRLKPSAWGCVARSMAKTRSGDGATERLYSAGSTR